ncbi:hypothetical protein ACFY5A_04540 [Microbacterium sp. NPDC012755]|uniref:hypothetical protein n=1 Tax=Microbacterium sp. NPDC012755 TaxID=3364184 RepID=UPI0036A22A2F
MSAATQVLSSLEFLASRRDQRAGGLNDWEIVRDIFRDAMPRMMPLLDRIGKERTETVIHLGRIAAGSSLFLPASVRAHRSAANAYLALTALLLHPKHFYGSDGSDQLAFLVQSTAAVAHLGDKPRRREAGLVFLAAQAGLSYVVSGVVKLASRTWRSGEALPGVLRTRTYGDERLYRFLKKHPRLSRFAAHGVLSAEVGFPLIFLMPTPIAFLGIGGMTVFHLLNARFMGLARFVWAFLATYPAVIFVIANRRRA